MNSRHDARATYTAKPQTTAQLEAASSWTREAGGASKAIGTVPAMRPRALLGASCESNGSKEKTLKSGIVGSRALAGQGLTQANFTFRDPPRGSGTTTHAPSADPRTLQLHLREFPFSPPSTPLLPESMYTHSDARALEDGNARTLFFEVATQEAGYIFLKYIKS